MKVKDVMNINASRVLIGSTVRQAAEQFVFTGASDLVVVDAEGRFLGVLSEGDVMRAALPQLTEIVDSGRSLSDSYDLMQEKGRVLADKPLDDLVIRDPVVLSPDDTLLRAATLMASRQIRRLPVVHNRQLVGTVSRADICRALFR